MNVTTLIYISFGVSLVLTGWHLTEEYVGRLWDYFGLIAGVLIPRRLGISVFTVGLGATLVLAAVGILDLGGGFDGYWLSLLGVGFLIGGRVSDWWHSHFTLQKKYQGERGFRGNPGWLSSWFYLADAALLVYLLYAFREGWRNDAGWPALFVGLLSGVLLFLLVIPTIKGIRNKLPARYVKDPWEPYQPMPKWATDLADLYGA
jgi:hypothetical protein